MSRSGTLQESHVESTKYQHYCDVYDQPNPEVVSQEQDVHADDNDYERDHVKHDGQVLSHALLRITLIREHLWISWRCRASTSVGARQEFRLT
jgi:hypothetical protein